LRTDLLGDLLAPAGVQVEQDEGGAVRGEQPRRPPPRCRWQRR